jgi:hypothetical protein
MIRMWAGLQWVPISEELQAEVNESLLKQDGRLVSPMNQLLDELPSGTRVTLEMDDQLYFFIRPLTKAQYNALYHDAQYNIPKAQP